MTPISDIIMGEARGCTFPLKFTIGIRYYFIYKEGWVSTLNEWLNYVF